MIEVETSASRNLRWNPKTNFVFYFFHDLYQNLLSSAQMYQWVAYDSWQKDVRLKSDTSLHDIPAAVSKCTVPRTV